MRYLFMLVALLTAGAAVAQEETPEPESELYWTADTLTQLWYKEPECPEGWGRVVVKMPPGYEYETVEIHCGLVVEPDEPTAQP